jgi:lysophospholipase L1-like esterase
MERAEQIMLTIRGLLRVLCFNCVALFLLLVMVFVTAEAGFQVSHAIRSRVPANPNWIYDEDLLYRRGNLPVASPKNGRFRILFLGDSLIGGAPEDNVVDRLKRIVNRNQAPPPTEWINAGVPGYTNYQELVFLKKFGLPMQPDLVGVVFCLNDVHRFLYDVGVANGRAYWGGVPAEAANSTNGWALRFARRSLFLQWLKSKTTVVEAAVDMYERGGYDFDYRPDFSTAWQDSQWTMIHDQMSEMTDLANQQGFGLFLVVVPFAEQYRKDYLARDANHVLKPQRILSTITGTLGIPYLDLYPYLDKSFFVSDLIHLNELGRERVAQKIAEFLGTEGLLPAR